MKISQAQQHRFFREWSKIKSAHGWTHEQAETERHALLQRAGYASLKDVDPVNGYTAVLKELAALQENIAGMVRADANSRRMMIWNIKHKSLPGYWESIARDRFGTADMDLLTDTQLQQLLYTVSDRAVGQHRVSTEAARKHATRQRRATPAPDARIKFPASDLQPAPVGSAICPVPSAIPSPEIADIPF